MKITRNDIEPDLMLLLARLKAYIVEWKFSFVPAENEAYEIGTDREAVDLRDPDANVVSSEIKALAAFGPRHVVALDIDHQAYLVPSSTEGHSHLYIDVPGGIPHEDYMELLGVLAKCKIIEPGYADVSQKRGHSDLRLPWVSKTDQKLATVEEMEARLPTDVDPLDKVDKEAIEAFGAVMKEPF